MHQGPWAEDNKVKGQVVVSGHFGGRGKLLTAGTTQRQAVKSCLSAIPSMLC